MKLKVIEFRKFHKDHKGKIYTSLNKAITIWIKRDWNQKLAKEHRHIRNIEYKCIANVYTSVSQAWKRDYKRDEEVQSSHSILGFWHGCWWMCRWTLAVLMHMHSGFPTGRLEKMIMTSFCDVMRISHPIEGGNYKRRAQLSFGAVIAVSGCPGTNIWVY